MFLFIYTRPLWSIILFAAIALTVWNTASAFFRDRALAERVWRLSNAFIALLATFAIAYGTVFDRIPGVRQVLLKPFISFQNAKNQPEIYRELIMNAFLFFPLGLSFSAALSPRWHIALRMILTGMLALAISCGVEYLQYYYCLGITEVDDIIFNTLGAVIGASQLIICRAVRSHRRHFYELFPFRTNAS